MNDEQMMNDILMNQARMEEQIKTLFRNQAEIRNLTETVQRLAVALEKQGAALSSNEQKLDGVKNDVDELKARPSRRWETMVAAVISGFVGFLLAKLGLK